MSIGSHVALLSSSITYSIEVENIHQTFILSPNYELVIAYHGYLEILCLARCDCMTNLLHCYKTGGTTSKPFAKPLSAFGYILITNRSECHATYKNLSGTNACRLPTRASTLASSFWPRLYIVAWYSGKTSPKTTFKTMEIRANTTTIVPSSFACPFSFNFHVCLL